MNEPILETKNLVSGYASGYGKITIIHGVSIRVNRGDIFALIGPNGSGKSTILKSIYGLAQIYEGKVFFKGEDITHTRTDLLTGRGMGYVPQMRNVFPDFTVEENLEMGTLRIGDKRAPLYEMREVFELFPILKERKRHKARTLSGGERQMLAVAISLMGKPELLFLDEPTASLAPLVAEEVLDKIKEVRSKGVTLVVVEQNARMLLRIADRGCVLVQGKKVYEDTSERILNNDEIIRIYLGLT